jgi:phosphoenolpyruvate carboxylase
MKNPPVSESHLSNELKHLVRLSMEDLGDCFKTQVGVEIHAKLMSIRQRMVKLRDKDLEPTIKQLERELKQLEGLSQAELFQLTQGFTLMMEIMNICENAYRAWRWSTKEINVDIHSDKKIIWVLTAHPTESRSRSTVILLQHLQELLAESLASSWNKCHERIHSIMTLIVNSEIAPQHKPRPTDEAQYLYEICLQKNWLDNVLDQPSLVKNFRLRTWVGGDKDGHPGIDEKVMKQSLELSRGKLLDYLEFKINQWLELSRTHSKDSTTSLRIIRQHVKRLKVLKPDDFELVKKLKTQLVSFFLAYDPDAHSPFSKKIFGLFDLFPALVIPLELRESSDVLEECVAAPVAGRKNFAINRMVKLISDFSSADNARYYVQAFIISMTHSSTHLKAALTITKWHFDKPALPIVPLFETHEDLLQAGEVTVAFLNSEKAYRKMIETRHENRAEIMLGYSDSSKQAGVLSSRVSIKEAMAKVERQLKQAGMETLFFNGSGGSVARGGGSFEEQAVSMGKTALTNYKATIQGEVISRTFSSPKIFLSQINRIAQVQNTKKLKDSKISPAMKKWAEFTRLEYERKVTNPEFLDLIKRATLYPYLHELKIGSRPSKRKSFSGVQDLRAIPWVLCWTQNRALFLNWWGLGSAWDQLSAQEKNEIKRLYNSNDSFINVFLKQLAFSLAKVELSVWSLQLKILANDENEFEEWDTEFCKTLKAFLEITDETNLLWFRPWLGESIYLRSALIYPLNLIQIIAIQRKDKKLLRATVTGIASGMLTTG